jgi:hypothetical protein
MRSCNFWRLMFNKVTLGSYGYFFKFSYFFWYRNGILQVGQKLQKLVKKTEGILGVKLSVLLRSPLFHVEPHCLNSNVLWACHTIVSCEHTMPQCLMGTPYYNVLRTCSTTRPCCRPMDMHHVIHRVL